MSNYKCVLTQFKFDHLTLNKIYDVGVTSSLINFVDDNGCHRSWPVKFLNEQFELVKDEPANTLGLCAPTVAEQRKATPVYSGVLKYFPLALQEVARCSKAGNDQHNPGEPLHWAREKSGDELDALTRHLLDAGTVDTDGVRHSTKVAWRALANLEKELEDLQCDPVEAANA
jgi:hypothetical protein